MGRGWKRVRKLSTAPVPSPTIVFQSPEAKPQGEELRGDQRERAADPDLDGPDRHPAAEVAAPPLPGEVVLVQPGLHATPEPVHLPGSAPVAGESLRHAAPGPPD